jgi:hypothetical protein
VKTSIPIRWLQLSIQLAIALTAGVAGATTVTLNPLSDAYVNDSKSDGNYKNDWLVAGRSPAEFTPRYRSFLRFNLAGIPANATVASAVLRLNLQSLEGGGGAQIELRRVLASWTSATLTWNNQPPMAAPVAMATVGTTLGADYTWPVTGLVQDWVSGQYANDGLSLRIASETAATAIRTFASANHSTTSIRPELVVTYTLPPDIDLVPTALNFGNQLPGTTAALQTVKIQNTGNADLRLASIQTTHGDFKVSLGTSLPATISPGGSLPVQISFAPANPGFRNMSIVVSSDDPDEPSRELICTGLGLPELSRSTFYDGSAGASSRFTAMSGLGSNIAMTVEAWVRRDDPSRTEAILSHNRSNSFWFGFAGPRLRFYRSGGQYADSTDTVAGQRWTHVAAAYDGSRVEFFIDGRPAGANVLGHFGAAKADSVQLAGDEQGANFLGFLDEVRLWDHSRSEQEIRDAMFDAAGPLGGLQALFPSGGPWEAIDGIPGQAGPGVIGREISVLREPLRIPRAIFDRVSVDGEIDPDGEYLGAAEIVIQYEDGPDAVAYLVHDGDPGNGNLYVAFSGLHEMPDGRDPAESWVAVGLDPNGSGSELASTFDLQFRGFLSADPGQSQMFTGDGRGGFDFYDVRSASNGAWQVAAFSPADLNSPNIEFRIPKSADWLWREPNRLMIGHFDLAEDDDNYLAPGGVVWNSPATWPQAIYVENTNMVPLVSVSGIVWNNDHDHPVTGQVVELVDEHNGVVRASTATDVDGLYVFELIPVMENHQVMVRLGPCEDCHYLRSRVWPNHIQAVTNLPQVVIFPPPEPGTNRYAAAEFFLRLPIGPISLDTYSPTQGVPRLRLRDVPEKLLMPEDLATKVTISGANLHQAIQVFLYSCLNLPPDNLANAGGCVLGQDYFEARIVARADDDSWVQVEVPHVPRRVHDSPWSGPWGWAVKDNWARPGRVEWNRLGGFANDTFALQLPPYPLVFGFEFRNQETEPNQEDFDGVFGENAFDDLIGCVRDPVYVAYFNLIYTPWIRGSGGSCCGLAATSQRFFRLLMDAEDSMLNSEEGADGIHFPAGFTNYSRGIYRDVACQPYRPSDLSAHIKVNHGVQTSDEYIGAVLDQMVGGLGSIEGDPSAVLAAVRLNPSGYVISMVPEIGRGHVVTPFAVVDGVDTDGDGTVDEPDWSRILVYDNNWPEKTNRFIEIRTGPRNVYIFPRERVIDLEEGWDSNWLGQGIYAMPIELWGEQRTAMDIGETLLEVARILVFGDADALVTDSDAGQWGWQRDGGVVDNLRGAKSITPVGGPNTSTRNVTLFYPVTNPPPHIQVNVRGSNHMFGAMHSGRLFTVEQSAGVAGDTDSADVAYEAGRLSAVRYSPQRDASNLSARIGLSLGERQSAVFEWSHVAVPGGATASFRALPAARGVEFQNDSTAAIRPDFAVCWLDGPSGNHGTNHFGPFDVPAGAIQRLLIHDWPTASQVRSEIDLNRDGVPDRIEIVNAIGIVPPLALTIQLDAIGQNLRLTWPATGSGAILEAATELGSPASWTILTTTREIVGQSIRVTVPATGANQFFRLRQ